MLTAFFALTTAIFAAIATYFSYREEKKTKEIRDQQKEIQRRIYELNLLSEITEKIGYSLNIENIAETIAISVENLFDLSTVSYAIIDRDKAIRIKTFIKEDVGLSYTQAVSKIIFDSISGLDEKLKDYQVSEAVNKNVSQGKVDTYFDTMPLSYFNIPLVVDNAFVGMINISSRYRGVYQDQDMSLLYKIINKAGKAIGRLHDVIETEKAKLDSMILSLPTGAILFGFGRGAFELAVINQAAKNFLHLEADSSINRVIGSFDPELKLIDKIKSVIAEKKSLIIKDIDVYGKTFTIYITPVFMHNTQNTIGVSLIMRDMTLEKKLEKMRADFTNMVVHELRAPLTAIKGASSLLLSSSLSADEEEKMMHIISDSARDMLGTISELLDVARVEEGKFAIRKVKSDLSVIAREHVEVFFYAAREKGTTINLEVAESLPQFFFDPGRIGQVINNLLSNSLKFTRQSGKIDIKIKAKEGQIQVKVADNGIGIPEAKLPLLFTKFGQIRQGFSREGSSGLGLFISRAIIESHGGKIWIESPVRNLNGKEEQGTAVYFMLPLITEEEKVSGVITRQFAN